MRMSGGWQHTAGLPGRWLTRQSAGTKQFMAADNKIFHSFAEAFKFLQQNKEKFSSNEINDFHATFSKPSSTVATSSNGMAKKVKSSRGRQQQFGVRRKNDEAFSRLKTIVENGDDPLDLEAAISELKTFGWYQDPSLPPGWLKFNPIKLPIQYLIFRPFCSRFLNKQAAVRGLLGRMGERGRGVDREDVIRFILGDSDIPHRLDRETDPDWEEHSSVPPGWRVRRGEAGGDSVEILSPDNICFPDRRSAFRLISSSRELFDQAELESLRSCLVHEGWEDHDLLPSGWKINRTEKLSRFLTSDGRVLRDQDEARSFVMETDNKFSIQEKKTFMDADQSLFSNPRPAVVPRIQLGEVKRPGPERLPDNWRMERLGGKVMKITASDGKTFYSRLQALEYMLETEEDPELAYCMWESLVEEDWVFGLSFLPPCWAVRRSPGQIIFLTKELVVLASVAEALEYIQEDEEYDSVSYKTLNDWWETFLGASWMEDSVLPPGWRKTETRMESEEEETQSELFLAPSGDIFKDKVSMIRHLIDKQGPLEHIIRLWRSLDTESWMVDNHQVPLGWKIRFDCELNQDEYLSPRMEVLKSREDILSLASVTSQSDESDKLLAHYIEKWSSLKV